MVEVDYTCGTSMAVLSWDESLGRESFTARVQSSDHADGCHTTGTHCFLSTLRCGSLYNVTVEAVARHCNSSEASTQLLTGRDRHTHTHSQKHTYTYTDTHTGTHTYIQTHTFTHLPAHTHTAITHSYTHTYTLTCTYKHTHTYIDTYT